jgi:hypothetical protein
MHWLLIYIVMKYNLLVLKNELRDFYPIYLRAHSHRTNQLLHFTGATLFFTLMVMAFALKLWWLAPVAVFTGYFLPGIGHKHFQKNHSFRASKPVLCVLCAFRLYLDTLTFQVNRKLNEAKTQKMREDRQ